ncbi:DUF1488 family protein [Bradyrhizobium sp. CCGE-LA001]|uniref:DUF1488 family protein n=1 Tax=Bradyrhizobium sp. CCGE-LA001 TaxID=1223566 RepID=UPI003FA460D8
MFNGGDRIVCRVECTALRDRAVADGVDPGDLVRTFRKHRAAIEQIASNQYDAGSTMPVVRTEHLAGGRDQNATSTEPPS